MPRREFIKAAGVTTAALTAGLIGSSAQGQAGRSFRVGLIGCGGRGTGAAGNHLSACPDNRIVALADLFEDRLRGCREYLQNDRGQEIADDHCFLGFDAYDKLCASDVDIVLMATPPYFRPIHLRAAIEAGRHVFMEKPVAVDPWGCREIIAAGDLAKEQGLAIVAGTQRRHQKPYVETYAQVQQGLLGEIQETRAYWVGGPLGGWDQPSELRAEQQIRNWFHYTWLSGDHMVEQHVHNLDVCNWFTGMHPVSALGMGYRALKTRGDGYDFFAVDYEYPNGAHMMSLCRQIAGCDGNVSEYIIGSQGKTHCWGEVWDLAGQSVWKMEGDGGRDAYEQEHADLVQSIVDGEPLNEAQGVAESTLTAIMGRESAYTGKRIAWDQILNAEWRLGPRPEDLQLDMELPVDPAPQPGRFQR